MGIPIKRTGQRQCPPTAPLSAQSNVANFSHVVVKFKRRRRLEAKVIDELRGFIRETARLIAEAKQ